MNKLAFIAVGILEMGAVFGKDFEVTVKTGDVKGAGTDANIYCTFIDEEGSRSRDILLDCLLRNDFEKGNVDTFAITDVKNLSK